MQKKQDERKKFSDQYKDIVEKLEKSDPPVYLVTIYCIKPKSMQSFTAEELLDFYQKFPACRMTIWNNTDLFAKVTQNLNTEQDKTKFEMDFLKNSVAVGTLCLNELLKSNSFKKYNVSWNLRNLLEIFNSYAQSGKLKPESKEYKDYLSALNNLLFNPPSHLTLAEYTVILKFPYIDKVSPDALNAFCSAFKGNKEIGKAIVANDDLLKMMDENHMIEHFATLYPDTCLDFLEKALQLDGKKYLSLGDLLPIFAKYVGGVFDDNDYLERYLRLINTHKKSSEEHAILAKFPYIANFDQSRKEVYIDAFKGTDTDLAISCYVELELKKNSQLIIDYANKNPRAALFFIRDALSQNGRNYLPLMELCKIFKDNPLTGDDNKACEIIIENYLKNDAKMDEKLRSNCIALLQFSMVTAWALRKYDNSSPILVGLNNIAQRAGLDFVFGILQEVNNKTLMEEFIGEYCRNLTYLNFTGFDGISALRSLSSYSSVFFDGMPIDKKKEIRANFMTLIKDGRISLLPTMTLISLIIKINMPMLTEEIFDYLIQKGEGCGRYAIDVLKVGAHPAEALKFIFTETDSFILNKYFAQFVQKLSSAELQQLRADIRSKGPEYILDLAMVVQNNIFYLNQANIDQFIKLLLSLFGTEARSIHVLQGLICDRLPVLQYYQLQGFVNGKQQEQESIIDATELGRQLVSGTTVPMQRFDERQESESIPDAAGELDGQGTDSAATPMQIFDGNQQGEASSIPDFSALEAKFACPNAIPPEVIVKQYLSIDAAHERKSYVDYFNDFEKAHGSLLAIINRPKTIKCECEFDPEKIMAEREARNAVAIFEKFRLAAFVKFKSQFNQEGDLAKKEEMLQNAKKALLFTASIGEKECLSGESSRVKISKKLSELGKQLNEQQKQSSVLPDSVWDLFHKKP